VHNTVSIIGSKTRPKLLSLYLASRDGKVASKKYIIKGSEDLRIDECVIQTFVRLNRVVASKYSAGPCDSGLGSTDGASTCATAQLTVYNVVPIDVHGGLIEVVENAPSLVQMYSQHAARADALTDHANSASAHGGSPTGATSMDSRPQRQPASDIQQTYMSHAQRVLKAANLPTNTPFAKWPAKVTTDTYESLLRLTPVDLLHRQLQREAQSSAHLYLATKNMVKSIGINSVAGYMLGLGDRHLDNLLVNVRSGKLVQIDFNVCFDFGGVSQFPELVPFRMTPILEYLCGSPAQVAVSSPNSAVSVVQRP
ncbi:Serine/threonine-protein kinase smg1, partial [Coemansia sp. RSA 2320]